MILIPILWPGRIGLRERWVDKAIRMIGVFELGAFNLRLHYHLRLHHHHHHQIILLLLLLLFFFFYFFFFIIIIRLLFFFFFLFFFYFFFIIIIIRFFFCFFFIFFFFYFFFFIIIIIIIIWRWLSAFDFAFPLLHWTDVNNNSPRRNDTQNSGTKSKSGRGPCM